MARGVVGVDDELELEDSTQAAGNVIFTLSVVTFTDFPLGKDLTCASGGASDSELQSSGWNFEAITIFHKNLILYKIIG